MTPTRREVLALAAALAAAPAAGAKGFPSRVVPLDWGLAATVISLGATPAAMAETRGYADWVGEPAIPAGVADIGLRLQPNLSALAAVRPDLFLVTPQFASIRDRLAALAPVETLALYDERREPLARAREVLGRVGVLLGREARARKLAAAFDADLAAARAALGARGLRPLLILSLIDARHARVYGAGGLYAGVAEAMGLHVAWKGPVSVWGSATVQIAELARMPEARAVLVNPIPPPARAMLDGEGLWARLPFARAGRVMEIPPAWAFGDLSAARRFARLLRAAIAETA